MMKKMFFCLMAMISVLTVSAQTSVYDFAVRNDLGQEVQLSTYKGNVLLIVNTATLCGFTPQYTELESLYEQFHESGFEILDFPCNQFGEQAPGSIQEIHEFCTLKYNIEFPQFDKIDVNGHASPARCRLRQEQRHQVELHQVPHQPRRQSSEALRAYRQDCRHRSRHRKCIVDQ